MREHVAADQPERVGGLREVDGQEVGVADQLVERVDELHSELARPLLADERVVGDELHAERERPLRDEHADAPEPDDAERLAVELDTLPAAPVPLAALQVRVGLGDVASLRQQERDRVLGRRQHVRLWRVHHHDATARRGLDVDVVEADPGPADHDEVATRVEDGRGDLRRAADDQCRRARHRAQELVG